MGVICGVAVDIWFGVGIGDVECSSWHRRLWSVDWSVVMSGMVLWWRIGNVMVGVGVVFCAIV